MQCDEGCGECCGIIPTTETEYKRVERYIKEHNIQPVENQDDFRVCPFYQGGKCAIYPVRPLICQVFGHADNELLTCPRGYNVNVPERQIHRMLGANGKGTRVLHDMIPGFREKADQWAASQIIIKAL